MLLRGYRAAAILLLGFVLLTMAGGASASATDTVPHRMHFQGRLTASDGLVVPNGTYNMRFRLYETDTGGSPLWESTRLVSAGKGVEVKNGQFSLMLGEVVVLDPDLFDGTVTQQLYLEVELPTPATATSSSPSWTEGAMTPRNQVLSSAYSFNADMIDGLDGSVLGRLDANNLFSESQTFNGATITVGGATNANKFNVGGIFNVDTATSRVVIGSADTTGTLLVLDTKTNATDPTGVNGGMYYNSNLGKFRCFEDDGWKDCIGTRQIRSFVDTTVDTAADNDTSNYWDIAAENNSSFPNLTPSSTSKSIIGTVSFETSSTSTADRSIVARIERSIGSPAACNAGTPVGSILSTFTTNSGEQASNSTTFVDSPSTSSRVYYTLCADSATSAAGGMTVTRIRFTLEEANNSNS